jgi:hypothetical protein
MDDYFEFEVVVFGICKVQPFKPYAFIFPDMCQSCPGFDFGPEKSKDVTIYGDVISKPFGQSFRRAQPVKEYTGRAIQGIF